MAVSVKKPIIRGKGLLADYKYDKNNFLDTTLSPHTNVLYLTTDTHEIWFNGKRYADGDRLNDVENIAPLAMPLSNPQKEYIDESIQWNDEI